jgi:hypothetical protein
VRQIPPHSLSLRLRSLAQSWRKIEGRIIYSADLNDEPHLKVHHTTKSSRTS